MNNKELKEDFVKYFGEEKWNQEDMLTKLKEAVAPLRHSYFTFDFPIILFDETNMPDASRYDVKEDIIWLSPRHQDDYEELLECVIHELEHKFQLLYIASFNTPKALRWKKEFDNYIDGNDPVNNILQEVEIDAMAITQIILKDEYNIIRPYEPKEVQYIIDNYIKSGIMQSDN